MARHLHGGQPCRFGLKKTCDQHYREFRHGHHGRRCVMTIGQSRSRKGQPNERPSCSLVVAPERGMSFEGLVRAAGITADCCSEIVPR